MKTYFQLTFEEKAFNKGLVIAADIVKNSWQKIPSLSKRLFVADEILALKKERKEVPLKGRKRKK